ncbi:SusC/RagA family TonB-linked outer membrane protein [Portibacter lacus]|uniref:SusC/RagA family TonB-linked outer membrane protein n=1 Tax=Portibacter lacus TaxID=1099794 RepID=A0AA37SQI1_9BACT|nr:SusC/RagA family TonB-linked outer membrane protein [Portibacter lacus]GLR18197.1 SusC/RagA family TonB-linked outer membrane protein [Portibacter lacus]
MKKITKNIFLLILLGLISSSQNISLALGKTSYVSTQNDTQKVKLSNLLNEISKHYGVGIIFDAEQVDKLMVEKQSYDQPIDQILKKVLKTTGLDYKKLNDQTYVIKLKKDGSTSISNKTTEIKKIEKIKIYGVIMDSETREPLIGANIIEAKTKQGTIADIDGNYELTVEEGAVLDVSYISYESKEVIAKSAGEMNIFLSKSAKILDEVVVVGYGSQKKSDLTGAVSSIGLKELEQLPSTGLEQALQGRSAGVFITQNSGAPGGGMSVRIRGTGSTLTAEPLYVIDGIPIVNDNQGTSATFERDGGGQYSSALTTINPNDIESIEILKDASATAIYGARAANGVVLITTKKGTSGSQTISFDSYVGMQQLYKTIPVMDLRQYAEYLQDIGLGTNVEEFENLDLLGPGTDWQDVIFRNAFMRNNQFSLTGGSEKTRFSFTAGVHKKNGIVIGSDFSRNSTKLNVDHSFNKKVRIGANILASRTKENITFNDNSNGVIYTALLTPPLVPAKTLDGNFGAPPDGNNIVLQFDNPLANAVEIEDINRKSRLLGSIYAEFDVTSWLKYRMELATDVLYTNHNTFWPAYDRGTVSRKSKVRRNNNNSLYWLNKHLLTFQKTIAKDHNVTVLAGFEAQEGTYEWLSASRENLPSNDLMELNLGDAGTQVVNGGAGHWALLSYFGRLNYGYADRYLLTSTLRADGSSRFGANNKYGLFPSLAFAWRTSQENFLKDVKQLSNLKFRVGYGAVGNQEIGLYSFASNLRATNAVIGNQLLTAFAPDNIANEDVKWESSIQFNLGMDLGLFNNRIEFIVDIYNKTSRDMLLPAILPATAGGLNPPFINIGEMRNNGLELTLNTQNLTGKTNWKTSANFSINRNEVVNLGSTGSLTGIIQQLPITRTVEGLPIGQYYGHIADGIFNDLSEIAEAPFQETGTRPGDIKFRDINGDGVINDADKTFIGSPHPDFTVNVINDINIGNFDISIFIRGVYGNEVFNMLARDIEGTGAWVNQSQVVLDRWTTDNLDAEVPRANGNDPNSNRRISSRFVEDGSYIRLQNASIGYTLPKVLTNKYKISLIRLYASGQNLFTFSKYSGYDPEIGSFNQNPLINGVDNGRFPVGRSITCGANINF